MTEERKAGGATPPSAKRQKLEGAGPAQRVRRPEDHVFRLLVTMCGTPDTHSTTEELQFNDIAAPILKARAAGEDTSKVELYCVDELKDAKNNYIPFLNGLQKQLSLDVTAAGKRQFSLARYQDSKMRTVSPTGDAKDATSLGFDCLDAARLLAGIQLDKVAVVVLGIPEVLKRPSWGDAFGVRVQQYHSFAVAYLRFYDAFEKRWRSTKSELSMRAAAHLLVTGKRATRWRGSFIAEMADEAYLIQDTFAELQRTGTPAAAAEYVRSAPEYMRLLDEAVTGFNRVVTSPMSADGLGTFGDYVCQCAGLHIGSWRDKTVLFRGETTTDWVAKHLARPGNTVLVARDDEHEVSRIIGSKLAQLVSDERYSSYTNELHQLRLFESIPRISAQDLKVAELAKLEPFRRLPGDAPPAKEPTVEEVAQRKAALAKWKPNRGLVPGLPQGVIKLITNMSLSGRCRVCEGATKGTAEYCGVQCKATAVARRGY